MVEQQQRGFRTWHDSTGVHREEAALVDRKAGVAYLSSSDSTLLEISESKLSEDDLNYIRSVGHKVTSYPPISLSVH